MIFGRSHDDADAGPHVTSETPSTMFPDGLRAINVGLGMFAEPLPGHGAAVVDLEWRPPADGDRDLGMLLARLEDDVDDPIGSRVAAANAAAVERLLAAQPMLIVKPADGEFYHKGDPVRKGAGGVQGGLSPFAMSMGGLTPLGMGGGLTPYIGEYTPITADGSPIKPDYFAN